MLGNAEVVVASAASVAFAVGCVAVVVAGRKRERETPTSFCILTH